MIIILRSPLSLILLASVIFPRGKSWGGCACSFGKVKGGTAQTVKRQREADFEKIRALPASQSCSKDFSINSMWNAYSSQKRQDLHREGGREDGFRRGKP